MYVLRRHPTFFLTSILVIAVLVLVSLNAGKERNFTSTQRLLVEVLSPLLKAVTVSKNSVVGFWKSYIYLVNMRKENEALRETIKALKEENYRYREAVMANMRLKKLLDFKENVPVSMLPAQVVGWDPSTWFQTIIIDKGTSDGIERNLPVVNSDGIIGRIIQNSSHYSKALLIIDRNSSVDSVVQRTRDRGILEGRGDGNCELRYFSKNDDVKSGDTIISSGLGGIFPKGLPLGKVTRVEEGGFGLFKRVEVTPMVDFSRLEEVLVILGIAKPFG